MAATPQQLQLPLPTFVQAALREQMVWTAGSPMCIRQDQGSAKSRSTSAGSSARFSNASLGERSPGSELGGGRGARSLLASPEATPAGARGDVLEWPGPMPMEGSFHGTMMAACIAPPPGLEGPCLDTPPGLGEDSADALPPPPPFSPSGLDWLAVSVGMAGLPDDLGDAFDDEPRNASVGGPVGSIPPPPQVAAPTFRPQPVLAYAPPPAPPPPPDFAPFAPPPAHAPTGLGAQVEAPHFLAGPPAAPAVGSPEVPTIGSAGHALGFCKPCAFFYTKGCGNGVACTFCHLCDAGEKKRRKKEKRAVLHFARMSGVA